MDVSPAFRKVDREDIVLIRYQHVNCHMILDVKMKGFCCKAMLLAGAHTTYPPDTITYAIVVSSDTVRILLTLDSLNDFPVKVENIQNAHITAPVTEKIWALSLVKIVVGALYGLKSAGAAFWSHLVGFLHHLGLLPCPADLYIWMNLMVRSDYRFNYYAYSLIYVNDVMVIYHDAERLIRRIDKSFKLKSSLISDSDIYLGAKLNKFRLENGVW